MHVLSLVTLFIIVLLIGIELCVSLFINPVIWQLEPEPQAQALSLFAALLGKLMPVWYGVCLLLLAVETWLHWHTQAFLLLVAATALWLAVIVVTILVLVPINNRIAARSAVNWQQQHRRWDTLHRFRVLTLFVVAALLAHVLLR